MYQTPFQMTQKFQTKWKFNLNLPLKKMKKKSKVIKLNRIWMNMFNNSVRSLIQVLMKKNRIFNQIKIRKKTPKIIIEGDNK